MKKTTVRHKLRSKEVELKPQARTVRQCVSCKQKLARINFIRILKEHRSGEYIVNPGNKVFGKSFYICKSQKCIGDLEKNKRYKDKINIEEIKELISNGSEWKS
jgi:predicted RNA-binding protein YlxR (DUF448 family)